MNDGEHGEAGEDQAGHRQGVNAPGEQTTGSAGRRSALRGDIGVGGCHRKPSVGAQWLAHRTTRIDEAIDKAFEIDEELVLTIRCDRLYRRLLSYPIQRAYRIWLS